MLPKACIVDADRHRPRLSVVTPSHSTAGVKTPNPLFECDTVWVLEPTLDCCCVHIRRVDDYPQNKHNLPSNSHHKTLRIQILACMLQYFQTR